MGTLSEVDGHAPVHAYYSPQSWIEGTAVSQAEHVAGLPGVCQVATMPDLHAGKYGPVGCSILATDVYPAFAGSDIGCGMALFQLDVPVRKLRLEAAAERLAALEGPWAGDRASLLSDYGLQPGPFDESLGTVGGGNHFCEVQATEEIRDAALVEALGLEPDRALLLIHSGSRGLGYSILQEQMKDGLASLPADSEAAARYFAAHDNAFQWAALNRLVIAMRAAEALRTDFRVLADLSHNFIERTAGGILHRKGAAPADRGPVPVPGSRATLSYLMQPSAAAPPDALASLAHGAGRKHDRASMHGRVKTAKSDLARLARNPFGGYVVCTDRNLLVEEAGEAYKSINGVIDDLERFGLADVTATMRPLVTFKTARQSKRDRRQSDKRDKRRGREVRR